MQVVILAGGLATRLQALFPGMPKSLVPVAGRPFLDWQLENLARRGATSALLCVAHLSAAIQEHVARVKTPLPVTFSNEGPTRLGTGGALRAARAAGLLEDRFVVGFGDSYLPADLAALMATHVAAKTRATMTVFRNEDWRLPSNCIVENGRVTWYEKADQRPPGVHWIDYGLTAMERSFVDSWSDPDPLDLSAPLTAAVHRREIASHEVFERFHEVGSEEGIRALEQVLAVGDPSAQG